MADKKLDQKQHARHLYMTQGLSQKEIADIVGVSERTVHTWIHQYTWNKLRQASFQAPVTIADNLCSQIVELQNTIASREPGKRFPTMEEAEVSRKLIASLEKVKKYPSVSQAMQIFESFRAYIRPHNKALAGELARYFSSFVEAKGYNGFVPYQPEYAVEQYAPVSPFYEETPGFDTDEEDTTRCNSKHECLHPDDCKYAHCRLAPQITHEHYQVAPDQLAHHRAYAATAGGNSAIPEREPIVCTAQEECSELFSDTIQTTYPATQLHPAAFPQNVPGKPLIRRTEIPDEVSRSNPAIAPSENHKNNMLQPAKKHPHFITTRQPRNNNSITPNHPPANTDLAA